MEAISSILTLLSEMKLILLAFFRAGAGAVEGEGTQLQAKCHLQTIQFQGSVKLGPTLRFFLKIANKRFEYFDGDHLEGTPTKMISSSKRKSSVDSQGVWEGDISADAVVDGGDTTFNLFAISS